MGWRLLGGFLFAVCAAMPVWALATGDLEQAARWAPLMALPLTGLGLALVLADRDRGHVATEVVGAQRRPWMAPPLDRMVERPELGDLLLAALMAPLPGEVGLTTGLAGAGGFGKTRLATWVCHRPEIEQRYPGGLLWATVGQEVRGADLAERVNDLAFVLSGERPAIADPDAAGTELGRLLDECEPVLLVVDDVWEQTQLRPFRFGGRCCTRLVTTRIPDLLPPDGARIAVDAMRGDQARRLVADGVVGLPTAVADRLAELAGLWPVLLNLVNGVLRRRVAWGQSPERAASEIVNALVAEGPIAFDPARPADRSQAVAATVEASLNLLDPDDRQRCLDLAIFPEDVDIPLDVLALLWPSGHGYRLSEELVGLGLVADYRLDAPGPRLVLHDVMRAYLRTRRSATEQADVHRRLMDAAAGLLPDDDEHTGVPWWLLPADASYLWRYVTHHLHQGGQSDELAHLVCDLRWVEAKTRRFGSVVASEADLELVDRPTATALRRVLRQIAPLLGPIDPPTALGATLASRLHGVPELHSMYDRYRSTLARPRLEPAWRLPDHSDAAQPPRSAHTGGLTSCTFSPDSTLLATASQDGTVCLWRVADGSLQLILIGHTGGVWDCAFSPDGAVLATAGEDRTVRLWQTTSGAQVDVLTGHTDWITRCAFSPDGTLLATTSADKTTRLWQLADNTTQAVLTGHDSAVRSCDFHPGGTLLATAGEDGTTRLWQLTTGTELTVLTGHSNPAGIWDCAFSPDGALLATAGNDRTVRVWQVATGAQRTLLIGHTTRARRCTFSPDGATLATAGYWTVRLWHIASGAVHAVLTGHNAPVSCAYSPDGTLLATADNNGARLWRAADGSPHAVLTSLDRRMHSCSFSPDGTLLATTGQDRAVRLWQVSGGRELRTMLGHSSRVNRCAFSPDGSLLATSGNDGTVRLWRVPDGTEHDVLTGHTGWVRGCAFSPYGALLATGGRDRTVRLWQVASGKQESMLTGHTDEVNSCAISPDAALLATASDDWTIRLWHLPDGAPQAVLTGHTDSVNGCAFSPNGTLLATSSDDRTVRLWHLPDGTLQAVLTGHTSWVARCAFSPDGTTLASVSYDGTVRLWHVASGRCHCALRLAGPVVGVAWHPAGTVLCTVGGAGMYMLNYLPETT